MDINNIKELQEILFKIIDERNNINKQLERHAKHKDSHDTPFVMQRSPVRVYLSHSPDTESAVGYW